MDGQFGTPSFIPKKPLATRTGSNVNFGGFFMFISVLIFILSVGGYGGLYFYERSIKTSAETLNKTLKDKLKEQAVTEQDVHNLFNFNNKIKIAKDLLYLDKANNSGDTTQHTTLLPLFKFLKDNTLKTVRFNDFKYSNIDNSKIDIRMSGEAKGYPSVAFQAEAFDVIGKLSNVVFTDLNLGPNNLVVFNMMATVDPSLVSYADTVKNALEQ
ncbi:MAG: hypothetical protein HZA94_02610 [Candidatus Vogelbacteria bacterium]|nr:hypothetical protein [Candidatus Vogelbacteria bacterium]